ncbi:Putative ABC sulfite/organosulfonate transporter, permease protein [Desulfonema limicola]|uniref:Probable membrane transporter protein n=1 Tax=Desulfonema limicola TaxID=45656 RepID=A0A975GFW2_9BACT|nr:sulfite exporter TauE/SafE family protein [Desulfonema limicola]QTA79677.1 Putative ABC sulfite/organosulfonate transporter, permease protein [Desulfonema limicola]
MFSVYFPVSGVEVNPLIPPVVAFVVSFFTSMGGVSGAFMLLPFQVSFLGYTAPSVSATNQVFNIVAIPSGVWRYMKEKRMVWSLTWAVIIGTLPGVFIGAWVRIKYLPKPENFKFFAGLVLIYIGMRMLKDILSKKEAKKSPEPSEFHVSESSFSIQKVSFTFAEENYSFAPAGVFIMCFIVGIIGGIYGIGGGSIVAPFFVTFFKLPVYTIAGAALMGTFVTSVAGVIFYQVLANFYTGMSVAPDWYLGLLFGTGGFAGMYLGARCQKYVPAYAIKLILCACILFVAGKYIIDFII